MAIQNEIDPVSSVTRPSPGSNLYVTATLDGTSTTASSDPIASAATGGKQIAVMGIVISNHGTTGEARVIVGSGNTPILGGSTGLAVPVGTTLALFPPDTLGPLCLTAAGIGLRVFSLNGTGVGGKVFVNLICRLV